VAKTAPRRHLYSKYLFEKRRRVEISDPGFHLMRLNLGEFKTQWNKGGGKTAEINKMKTR
jgi:hypothetical protein